MGPKPKKSKEEIEAEKAAEEAERAKQAAIAAKKAAELAEKARLEELRLAEERRVQRQAEFVRLGEELAVYQDKLRDRQAARAAEDALLKSRMEWERYRNPSDQPDALSQRDMNTFISLTMETKVETMPEMLEFVKKIQQVAAAVEDTWSDSYAKKDASAQAYAQSCLAEFSNLITEKVDQATAGYLHTVESQLNAKLELDVEESVAGVCIGMWGSLQEAGSLRPVRKAVQLEKMGLQLDIPKQVLQQSPFVHRVIKIPIDPFSLEAYAPTPSSSHSSNNPHKLVLSDLIVIDILIPPPLPYALRAKKWLIRDSSDGSSSLRKSLYPSSVPCKVFIKVPDDLIMTDEIKVALWNPDMKEWVEDALTDFQYSESTRLVQFLMATTGAVAFVGSRLVDFPYKRWSLTPIRNSNDAVLEQRAQFTVQTQRFEVVIDIVGTQCSLAKAFNRSVASLVGVPMSPGVLLRTLQKRGVNLAPVDADLVALSESNGISIPNKNADLEQDVLGEIAKCASCLDFTSTEQWTDLSEAQMGVLARESTTYTCFHETFDYECVLVEQDHVSESFKRSPGSEPITGVGRSAARFTLVFGNEYGNRRAGFDLKPRPGEVPHLELATAIGSRCTPEARERIERCNGLFTDTVFTLLSLVRPLAFTQA